ncbi:MAG TPA: SUMF1/EgtB/PvdO family nonheme iron enzyme, partial [Caldilineae bacterium]|nr:SUMF1/EgtB/PvdO family nonheme iron enzyme [Caldilineae bacterium]
PEGASPYGCLDMSGNVLEWCRTKWRDSYQDYEQEVDDTLEDDYTRVVRGGAFLDLDGDVRCAYRYWSYPHFRDHLIGFRVVFSPSTTGH